jgi:hypothetical protein
VVFFFAFVTVAELCCQRQTNPLATFWQPIAVKCIGLNISKKISLPHAAMQIRRRRKKVGCVSRSAHLKKSVPTEWDVCEHVRTRQAVMELWWLLCVLSLFAAASAIYPSVLTEYGVVTGVQDGNVMVSLGLRKFFERTRLLQLPLLTFFLFFAGLLRHPVCQPAGRRPSILSTDRPNSMVQPPKLLQKQLLQRRMACFAVVCCAIVF